MSDYNFGLNLVTLLNSLAILDDHEIDSNQVEVEVVEENGQEGFATVEIQSLAKDAADTITALQQKLDAMAAENASLKESVEHAAGCIHAAEVEGLQDALESRDGERLYDLVHRRLCHAYLPTETPATDTYLNSVRAEGVGLVKSHPAISLVSLTHICDQIAEQLRSGTHDTADKAG